MTDEAQPGGGPEAANAAQPGPEGVLAEQGRRELSDPREMRALTHPVRLALIEALGIQGPLTATEAGALIGESPSSCSFHLRQLEKYGFVEEAPGGVGRKRPWQLVSRGMRFSGTGDNERTAAAGELSRLLMDRWIGRHEQWQANQFLEADPIWSDVTGVWENTIYVTAEELAVVTDEVNAVFDRFRHRLDDPSSRPEGARPIEAVLFDHPLMFPGQQTEGGESSAEAEDPEDQAS